MVLAGRELRLVGGCEAIDGVADIFQVPLEVHVELFLSREHAQPPLGAQLRRNLLSFRHETPQGLKAPVVPASRRRSGILQAEQDPSSHHIEQGDQREKLALRGVFKAGALHDGQDFVELDEGLAQGARRGRDALASCDRSQVSDARGEPVSVRLSRAGPEYALHAGCHVGEISRRSSGRRRR